MRVRLATGTPRFVFALWLAPLVVRSTWARASAALLAAGCTWFFRDPERTPDGDGLVAAADGVVQWVQVDGRGRETISTYLNLFDVHVTRAPCDARVVGQTYRPGSHRRASSRSAHLNERMEWTSGDRPRASCSSSSTPAPWLVASSLTNGPVTCCDEVRRSA